MHRHQPSMPPELSPPSPYTPAPAAWGNPQRRGRRRENGREPRPHDATPTPHQPQSPFTTPDFFGAKQSRLPSTVMGTVRDRRPGLWEGRIYVGRDLVTQAPEQVSRAGRARRATRTGRPPKAVVEMMHHLEAEASQGKLGGTTASVNVLFNQYLEHLERKRLSPRRCTPIESASTPRSGQPSDAGRCND